VVQLLTGTAATGMAGEVVGLDMGSTTVTWTVTGLIPPGCWAVAKLTLQPSHKATAKVMYIFFILPCLSASAHEEPASASSLKPDGVSSTL